MGILLFFIANIIVFFSAIEISRRIRLNTVSDKILSVLVIGTGQIILTELFLGVVIKRLYYPELLLINALILGIILIINKKYKVESNYLNLDKAKLKRVVLDLIKSPLLIILGVISLVLVAVITYLGINLPPYGWDEIWYHLTAVASWYQAGKIFMLTVPDIWNHAEIIHSMTSAQLAYHMSVAGFWYNVYPMNSELISLWNIIFLGNDTIVDLTQLPFSIMGVVAIYSLARKLGLRERLSAIAGLMFLVTPIVIIQSKTAYVDITFGVMIITAANFLMGFMKYKSKYYALMVTITSGIVLGTKSSGVAFSILFILLILVIDYWNNKDEYSIKRFSALVSITGSLTLLLGGFWYLRNFYYFGNPIYPYIVKIGGLTIFNGLGTVDGLIMMHNTPREYIKSSNLTNIISSWLEKEPYYSVDIRKAGFGALWMIVEVPSIIFTTYIAVKKRIKPLMIFLSFFILFFLTQPANWWTRYTVFIIALGTISTVYLLDHLNIFTKVVLSILIAGLSVYTTFSTLSYLGMNDISYALSRPTNERTIGGTFYSDFLWVDKVSKDKRIGYAPMTFVYPLFSPKLDNKVYMIDADIKDKWFEKIDEKRIEYITFLKNYMYYKDWIKSYPGHIEKIYDGRTLEVYKIDRNWRKNEK